MVTRRQFLLRAGSAGACLVGTKLALSAHTGTHMEAPRHSVAAGQTMETIPLHAVMGPCPVIELKDETAITVEAPNRNVVINAKRGYWATQSPQ